MTLAQKLYTMFLMTELICNNYSGSPSSRIFIGWVNSWCGVIADERMENTTIISVLQQRSKAFFRRLTVSQKLSLAGLRH